MPETADWQAIGTRLSAEINTLHASVDQLLASGVENARLDDEALEASMTASGITRLLLDLERYAATRQSTTHQPA
ncbi:hypothetical protein [Streptomyces sp. NPDC002467]|uniref:hypothetical protein n=1 Tax=Streptomyces sp. NPDC002467 TaxID=3364647 RepID=UPI0036AD6D4D